QRHRQAAANQHSSVRAAQSDVHEVTGGGERLRVHIAINGVAAKHAAEEHDFGQQKYPHPQRGRFELLFDGIEMMAQSGGMSRVCKLAICQAWPPRLRSCRLLPSRWAG